MCVQAHNLLPPPQKKKKKNPGSASELSETLSISGLLSGQQIHSLSNDTSCSHLSSPPTSCSHLSSPQTTKLIFVFTFQLSLGTDFKLVIMVWIFKCLLTASAINGGWERQNLQSLKLNYKSEWDIVSISNNNKLWRIELFLQGCSKF